MPTPPPWWKLTQVAPAAVLTRALRIGQSAIASEPSRIASVSRFGVATQPASRWSRPMTIGAPTSPEATSSLTRSPAGARRRSRASRSAPGAPGTGPSRAARRSQRWSPSSSGKSSVSARSMRAMSAGSPDSAAPRNGPLPSQKSGRMKAGTKPGKSKAFSTPASRAMCADVVAVVEGHGAAALEREHRPHVLGHRGLRAAHVVVGVARAQRERIGQGKPVGDVAVERVVGGGLVGDEVGVPAAPDELRQDVGGVADERHRTADRGRGASRRPSRAPRRATSVSSST